MKQNFYHKVYTRIFVAEDTNFSLELAKKVVVDDGTVTETDKFLVTLKPVGEKNLLNDYRAAVEELSRADAHRFCLTVMKEHHLFWFAKDMLIDRLYLEL